MKAFCIFINLCFLCKNKFILNKKTQYHRYPSACRCVTSTIKKPKAKSKEVCTAVRKRRKRRNRYS